MIGCPLGFRPAPRGSSVAAVTTPVGWARHREGVARLLASYAALRPQQPVRLRRHPSLVRAQSVTRGPGLDVSRLTGVIVIDRAEQYADVQGFCSYPDLVATTLARGMLPRIEPPPVLEMDVLTADGEIVTTQPGEELFEEFPERGGYATRIRVPLAPAPTFAVPRQRRGPLRAFESRSLSH